MTDEPEVEAVALKMFAERDRRIGIKGLDSWAALGEGERGAWLEMLTDAIAALDAVRAERGVYPVRTVRVERVPFQIAGDDGDLSEAEATRRLR